MKSKSNTHKHIHSTYTLNIALKVKTNVCLPIFRCSAIEIIYSTEKSIWNSTSIIVNKNNIYVYSINTLGISYIFIERIIHNKWINKCHLIRLFWIASMEMGFSWFWWHQFNAQLHKIEKRILSRSVISFEFIIYFFLLWIIRFSVA